MEEHASILRVLMEQQAAILDRMAEAQQANRPQSQGKSPQFKLMKMTGEDEPEVYLWAFERVALAAGWSKRQWAMILAPCLLGGSAGHGLAPPRGGRGL